MDVEEIEGSILGCCPVLECRASVIHQSTIAITIFVIWFAPFETNSIDEPARKRERERERERESVRFA